MVDTRSRAQKQHDTLAAVLGIAARHDEMPRLGGAAPTLVVTVTADDYIAGRGWAHVDGIDVPVSVRTAAHTACAGGVQRVLFDPAGRIIGIDTSDRIFNAHQRRAITLRDCECLIPGCHVPATWCEIHHVQEHSRGGPTTPITASPSAGTITVPSTPPDGRSACDTAPLTSAAPRGGIPADDGACPSR